jgi:hypothetical protein
MKGIQNHQRRNAPVISNDLGLIGVVLKGLVALVVLLIVVWFTFLQRLSGIKSYKGIKQQGNPKAACVF